MIRQRDGEAQRRWFFSSHFSFLFPSRFRREGPIGTFGARCTGAQSQTAASFWGGIESHHQATSFVGDGMVPVAVAFAVLGLTGSVADVGLVFAARLAPLACFLIIGGVIADRLSRRTRLSAR